MAYSKHFIKYTSKSPQARRKEQRQQKLGWCDARCDAWNKRRRGKILETEKRTITVWTNYMRPFLSWKSICQASSVTVLFLVNHDVAQLSRLRIPKPKSAVFLDPGSVCSAIQNRIFQPFYVSSSQIFRHFCGVVLVPSTKFRPGVTALISPKICYVWILTASSKTE